MKTWWLFHGVFFVGYQIARATWRWFVMGMVWFSRIDWWLNHWFIISIVFETFRSGTVYVMHNYIIFQVTPNHHIIYIYGWWFGTFFVIQFWEFHHPSWRSPSFFRVGWNHQIIPSSPENYGSSRSNLVDFMGIMGQLGALFGQTALGVRTGSTLL